MVRVYSGPDKIPMLLEGTITSLLEVIVVLANPCKNVQLLTPNLTKYLGWHCGKPKLL